VPLRRGDSRQAQQQWQLEQPREQYRHSSWEATEHGRQTSRDRHPADSSGRYEHAQREREGRDRERDVRSSSREREQEQQRRQEPGRGDKHSRGREDRGGRHGFDASRGLHDDHRSAAADRGAAIHSSRHHSRDYSRSRSRSRSPAWRR
jgi:hypothetical protein